MSDVDLLASSREWASSSRWLGPSVDEWFLNKEGPWDLVRTCPPCHGPAYFPASYAPWPDLLLGRARLQPGEQVLEVGSGIGSLVVAAASRLGSRGVVVGLDIDRAMLDGAERRAPPAPNGVSLGWEQGDARNLRFDDASFDLVLCQQVLQFIPGQDKALKEMHRVLRPGGRLVLSVWREIQYSPGYARLSTVLRRHADTQARNKGEEPFTLGDSRVLRTLVAAAGFRDPDIRFVVAMLRSRSVVEWMGLQLMAAAAQSSTDASTWSIGAIEGELRAGLEAYIDDGGLAFPMQAQLLVACK